MLRAEKKIQVNVYLHKTEIIRYRFSLYLFSSSIYNVCVCSQLTAVTIVFSAQGCCHGYSTGGAIATKGFGRSTLSTHRLLFLVSAVYICVYVSFIIHAIITGATLVTSCQFELCCVRHCGIPVIFQHCFCVTCLFTSCHNTRYRKLRDR